MKIYPAIDILDGNCVRLSKGSFESAKIYSENPLKVAKNFIDQGADTLHIVDLNGARQGKTVNHDLILKIAQTFNVFIQVGGGIRNFQDAVSYLEYSVDRIIISTSAITDPDLIAKIVRTYGPQSIAISLDIDNGRIALNGWEEKSSKPVSRFLKELKNFGITNLIFTDISKDGTLQGPNLEWINKLKSENFNLISAGGIATLNDLKNLKKTAVNGAIIGKALYENKINLKEALQLSKNRLTKRIIPCLDIADGQVVKGTHFKNLRVAGNPIKLAQYYSESGADELIFLDITASQQSRKTLVELAAKIAKNISIPFTIGGGITCVEDIRALLSVGADKVSIGTAAVKNPQLINESAKKFGSQCIVISLDVSRTNCSSFEQVTTSKTIRSNQYRNTLNCWELFVKGGQEATGIDIREFAKKMELLGAGELLINSIDRDGTKKGYDLELLNTIGKIVNIPIIASSGAGSKEDVLKAFTHGNADAALAASIFHNGQLTISTLKQFLSSKNIPTVTRSSE